MAGVKLSPLHCPQGSTGLWTLAGHLLLAPNYPRPPVCLCLRVPWFCSLCLGTGTCQCLRGSPLLSFRSQLKYHSLRCSEHWDLLPPPHFSPPASSTSLPPIRGVP